MRRARRPNKSETEFIRMRRDGGFPIPRRRGWPDFWWCDNDGRLCAAEVKPTAASPLSVAQFEMLSTLLRSGITPYVWIADDGLWIFDPAEWALCDVTNRKFDDGGVRYGYCLIEYIDRFGLRRILGRDQQLYERAMQGRLQDHVPNDRIGLSVLPKGTNARQHLRYLVSSVRELRHMLACGQKSKRLDSREMRLLLQSIVWILDMQGVYPSRYESVTGETEEVAVSRCMRRNGTKMPERSDDELKRSQKLWEKVRSEEGL